MTERLAEKLAGMQPGDTVNVCVCGVNGTLVIEEIEPGGYVRWDRDDPRDKHSTMQIAANWDTILGAEMDLP